VEAKPVLYLGDTSLATAAGYLAGLMSHDRVGYDYLPSDVAVNGETETPRSLYIISDYPAKLMDAACQRRIADRVAQGAGLLMIGGWESFHGHGGNWDGTLISDILPVTIDRKDDRINCDQPAVIAKASDHPILEGLPWDERPPTVGGFNRIAPKPDAQVLLEVQRFETRREGNNGAADWKFRPIDRHPLLVVGRHGQGRTAALATDIAPHWVGGLVDWGNDGRVCAEAPKSWQIEVGACYAKFINNLLTWTGRLNETARQLAAV
jgi:uncharacterized membrane protein